jgi:hypothetical protein
MFESLTLQTLGKLRAPQQFRARFGRRRTYLSRFDAAAYDAGWQFYPRELHERRHTPYRDGWLDARDAQDDQAAANGAPSHTTHRRHDESPTTFVQTAKGIVIGRSYVRPPAFPGTEAIRIQQALLRQKQRRAPVTVGDIVVVVLIVLVAGAGLLKACSS